MLTTATPFASIVVVSPRSSYFKGALEAKSNWLPVAGWLSEMDIFAFLVPAQPSGFVVGASETESRNCLPCTVAATSDTFVAAELLILKVQPPLNVNSFLSYTYSRRSHNFFFVVQVKKLSCWTRQRRRRTAGRGISPIYSNRYVQFVLARFGLSLPYALLLLQHH